MAEGWYFNQVTLCLLYTSKVWPRGQAVKTSPFHGGNTGSIPVGVIRIFIICRCGSIRAYCTEGQYEAEQTDYISAAGSYFADVAQLAEQLICNQQVIGSSPIIGFCLSGIHTVPYMPDLIPPYHLHFVSVHPI